MMSTWEERFARVADQLVRIEVALRRAEEAAEGTGRIHHQAIRRLSQEVFPGRAWPPVDPS